MEIQPSRLGRLAPARPGLLLVLVFAGLMLSACDLPFGRREAELPIPLVKLIPKEWKLVTVGRNQQDIIPVNIDGDVETEWLIFYHYDNPSEEATGPIGAIIYDAQFRTEAYDPEVVVPFPFQPSTFLVPYRLLPDWRDGKGQGFLGRSRVNWQEVSSDLGAELEISGDDGGGQRLSIFWWEGIDRGYGVSHFAASGGLETPGRVAGERVGRILAFDRLNERSYLCRRVEHTRQGNTHYFQAGPPSIVFCLGRPKEPTYPEAVVLAWLLEKEASLLLPEARAGIQPKLDLWLPQLPERVTGLTYSGEAEREGTGNAARSGEIVITTVVQNGDQQRYGWHLTETRPISVTDTARWRIDDVSLLP